MSQDKLKHSIKQIKTGKVSYTAETEAEGKAIVAACLAATEIFDSPAYLDHTLGKISAKIAGRWKEIDGVDFPDFPEGTSFFQLIIVHFRGHQKNFIVVYLKGTWRQGEIKWSIEYLSAPGHKRILSKEELKQFS